MSVRVVARVRPLWKSERELDVILRTGSRPSATKNDRDASNDKGPLAALRDRDTVVRIPNPKNENEEYTFQFNGVYDADVTQQELFDAEVAPTIKHLFNGFDVTLFAYGVTGAGKTHTMRGGKSLADRGLIPRLLSSIYRRSRKMEKDTDGDTTVGVSLSYYEIYNDKVFDLFEPPEKRTPAGLPLRDNGGKTAVVGLSERPCTSLKEFESLYDQANANRSTTATKLNAHSSRSHAILCVKLVVTSSDKTRISTASAIDLAGSEDNRRTDNDKERMVESASINKSLFVLAQCVEAMNKKQQRIPYRESKMTRILSLGQNSGLTVMILNLAPVRSCHLDTISALNFANRTKKIEAREVENEPMFKGPPRPVTRPSGANIQRQPLRQITSSANVNLGAATGKDPSKPGENKPMKAFYVYADKTQKRNSAQFRKPEVPKRSSLTSDVSSVHPPQPFKPRFTQLPARAQKPQDDVSAAKIEEMVEKKVEEILAVRAVSEQSRQAQVHELNQKLQKRLEDLEQRIDGTEDVRAEGLSYLLMGKQHQARGEDTFALKMYQLALPFFPHNEKLASKISTLQDRIQCTSRGQRNAISASPASLGATLGRGSILSIRKQAEKGRAKRPAEDADGDYQNGAGELNDDKLEGTSSVRIPKRARTQPPTEHDEFGITGEYPPSPRTVHLLSVINSRDVSQIRLLKGVGIKKAEAIAECLCEMDNANGSDEGSRVRVNSLSELSKLKGVGAKTLQNMRDGILV